MTDIVDFEEWKESENLCMLYAMCKLMTPEQRNIVTNILNLAVRMEDVKSCYKMDLFFKL